MTGDDVGWLAGLVDDPAGAPLPADEQAVVVELLSLYGFYADSGLVDAWLDLFAPDAVMEIPFLCAAPVGGGGNAYALRRFAGRAELSEVLGGPAHQAIQGRSQHHMAGPPAVFRRLAD